MSQPSDPTWVAPDSASSAPPAEPGATPETDGQPDTSDQGAGWGAPPGPAGSGGGFGGPPAPGGYGPAGGYGAPGTSAALFDGPAPVLVSFAPPAQQSRLTIAFRLLLAIPHVIILWALGIAAEVVVVIGWFAALFMGSLPEWAHTFLTGVLRWQVRVYAYTFFLTGKYPPFSLEDEPYPVRLVTARTRLNRFAVFFRLILVIPAGIVAGVASYGLAVLAFFCWLIALILGRLPDSLHQALGAILRLQIRYYGYFGMVTGEYPWWGLFGDPVPIPVTAPGPATDDGLTPAAPADPWKLPVSAAGARGLVALILILGALAAIASGVANAVQGGNAISNAQSIVRIGVAYGQLTSSSTKFETAVQACSQLSCVTAQDGKEAIALRTFAGAVSAVGITGSAGGDAAALASDANGAAQSLDKLAAATSVAQYQSEASASALQQQLNGLDADYTKLINDLKV
jgi:hypothetical protein